MLSDNHLPLLIAAVIIDLMRKLSIILLILIVANLGFAENLPRSGGYVNDFAHIISAQAVQQLETACASIEKSTGVEISIITVDSLGGEAIEREGLRYLEEWGVGKKGKDNGVVILVAEQEHEVRIETGYGIEEVLPDGKAGEIIRYDIVPRFKQGDYGAGLLAAVYKIGKIVGGELVAYPQEGRRHKDYGGLIYLIFILIFILSSFIGRRKGRGLGLLWFLTGFSMGGGFGGGGFSSGRSSGGFGGFGGGMGGGGGASGRW